MGREEADRPSWKTNAQRNAWRNFKRLGFGWKIPLDDFAFDTGEGEELLIPYISPKSYLEYLMKNHPDCVIGGLQSTHDCGTHLQAFWDAYKQQHKSHEVYRSRDDGPVLSYTLPILVHGDEGRGKRRTGTMAIFLESPIGIPSESKTTKKRKHGDCDCAPTPEEMNRFKPAAGLIGCNRSLHTVAEKMKTNTKNHSFLQRWPLIVIPGVVYKAYPAIVPAFHKLLARQLKALFFEGFVGPHGRTYYAALIGIKADLKWHAKIGEWNRSFENQGRTKEKECCHICLGGQPNIAWEDVSESPIWEPTMFQVRPWATAPAIVEPPFDFGKPEAVFRTDPFHTGKLGIFRDVIASALFWFAEKNYFGPGNLPDKLVAAHGSFKLFCCAEGASPALRSFTKALFMYKSKRTFPFANVKGSDSVLLMRWVVVQSQAFSNDPLNPGHLQTLSLIHKTASYGLAFYDRMYKHGVFLNRKCAAALYLDGNRMVAGFCHLAQSCLGVMSLWAIKPKIHMFRHCLIDIRKPLLEGANLVVNPLVYNCEGNEDAIGRIARLSRRLDSRHISQRILQCYLVKVFVLQKRLEARKVSRSKVGAISKKRC